MNKVCKVLFLCLITLALMACGEPSKEISAGRYGMMSDETPQYAALLFIMSVYEDKTIDNAANMSSDKFARLLKSYHTNKGVQRHILNLRLDEMTVEPVLGGFLGITDYKTEATVEVKISGTFNRKKVIDLKKVSLVKDSGDWKIVGVSNSTG